MSELPPTQQSAAKQKSVPLLSFCCLFSSSSLNGYFTSGRKVCGRKCYSRPGTLEPVERLFYFDGRGGGGGAEVGRGRAVGSGTAGCSATEGLGGGGGAGVVGSGCFTSEKRVCRKWHSRSWTSEPVERLFHDREEGLWNEVTLQALHVRTCQRTASRRGGGFVGNGTGGPGRQNLLNGCFSSRRRVCGRK